MSSPSSIRILLVDDHPVFRSRLRRWIETWGAVEVVGEADDGDVAVVLAKQLRPNVVVMDVQMPREDGVSACRRMKHDSAGIKVVLFSALADEFRESARGGEDAFLPKDRLFDELQAKVLRCLDST